MTIREDDYCRKGELALARAYFGEDCNQLAKAPVLEYRGPAQLSAQELKVRVNAFWSAYRELPNRIAVIRMAHELPAKDRQRMVAQMEHIEFRIEFFVSALRDDV